MGGLLGEFFGLYLTVCYGFLAVSKGKSNASTMGEFLLLAASCIFALNDTVLPLALCC